jgi:Flp pilus assembly protein TadG
MCTANSRRRRGAAVLELALVLPFLLMLLLGFLEVGRKVYVQMIIENAVGVGGRQASTGFWTNAEVQEAVTNYLRTAKLPAQAVQNAVVTVEDLTSPGTDASLADQMDELRVTVTIPFRDLRWIPSWRFTNDSTTAIAKATFRSARVDPYPTDIQPPPGY